MSEEQFATLLQFFKVLSNESRLKILGLLANEERSVGELAEILKVKEPTVSHHLALMKGLGLVNVHAEGNVRIYQLNNQALATMNKDLFSQDNLATLVDDDAADAWDQKVLRTFVVDGRITAFPSRHKKRLVLLNWVIDKLEWDRKYTELELNEILQQYNPDYAALRRYFIDNKLMAREKGIYWRI